MCSIYSQINNTDDEPAQSSAPVETYRMFPPEVSNTGYKNVSTKQYNFLQTYIPLYSKFYNTRCYD